MNVKRQTCQACNSINLRNILVRNGRKQVVYVGCLQCEALVARYVLQDYYHHGKGIESYLRAHHASVGDSGRAWLEEFQKSQSDAVEGYEEALKMLREVEEDI